MKVNPSSPAQIIDYNQLATGDSSALGKLAVLKLNGGLGTSMGKLLFDQLDLHSSDKLVTQEWPEQKALLRFRVI